MNTHELQGRLERLVKRAAKTERAIERVKADIEESKRSDDNTILVAGMRWARLNLGAALDKPNGELYDFDTAQKVVPQGWKIPTKEQWRQLYERTTSEWVTRDGVNGRLFTDKESGNELFLPAIGYRNWLDGTQYGQGSGGNYWSSSVNNSNYGYDCFFNSGGVNPDNNNVRGYGFSVRCVQELAA